MSTQDAYKQQVESRLQLWRSKLEELRSQQNLTEPLEVLSSKLDQAEQTFEALKDAGEEEWESAVRRLQGAGNEVQQLWGEVRARLQSA